MKHLIPVAVALSLSACVPQQMQTERGVGFQDYTLYQQRQAYLARARMQAAAPPPATVPDRTAAAPAPAAAVAPAPLVAAAPPHTGAPAAQGASLGAQTLAVLGVPAPGGEVQRLREIEVAELPLSAIGPQALSSGGAEAGVPSPAAAATTPAALPAPVGASGNNIVAFALATTHPVGHKIYRRLNLLGSSAATRACARYPSPGMAQEAFLSRGGPERDPMGLDPDGDGYACGWDPAPFRMVRG